MQEGIKALGRAIAEAEKVVVFTGAGVSTECGIPDFRSPGGLWSRYDPSDFYFHRFLTSEASRKVYWRMYREFFPLLHKASPGKAHHACKRLLEMGKLLAVITQNVDGLHQRAGVPEELVVELHGRATEVRCLQCQEVYCSEEIERRLKGGCEVPTCDRCGGLLKPATVSFGQALPPEALSAAEKYAKECDLMIAAGSSLLVHPAAMIPLIAQEGGAKLVIVNLTPTPYDERADLVIRGEAGEVMEKAVEEAEVISSRTPERSG